MCLDHGVGSLLGTKSSWLLPTFQTQNCWCHCCSGRMVYGSVVLTYSYRPSSFRLREITILHDDLTVYAYPFFLTILKECNRSKMISQLMETKIPEFFSTFFNKFRGHKTQPAVASPILLCQGRGRSSISSSCFGHS